jgi:hypothetical protein
VTWNKAIDKYISLGKDTRAKDVIERAAKIGESNGVLYRMCEGVGCTNTEGCGEVKVRLCSRCKIVSQFFLMESFVTDCIQYHLVCIL